MHEQTSNRIELPKDSGPHPSSNLEWWYYFAFLTGDKGSRFATMSSFFRVGELEWMKGHYLIFSLIDLDCKSQKNASLIDGKLTCNLLSIYLPFYLLQHPTDLKMWKLYQTLFLGRVPDPHKKMNEVIVKTSPTKLLYDQNKMVFLEQKEGSFHVHLEENDVELDLTFIPQKQMALIGENGKTDDLYYYSFSRNNVKGSIITQKGKENVEGEGWFDHQWGRYYGLIQGEGWNWFGIQLNDGRELLLNEMFLPKTGKTISQMANLIDLDGKVHFTRGITFKPLKFWRSLKTNAKFPIEWQIVIPEFEIDLQVKSIINNQEMPIIGPMQSIWEGACIITGQEKLKEGRYKNIQGKGFVELVGYAFNA